MKPKRPRWKWFVSVGFGIAALVTLVFLVVAIEGYRSRRAWEACRLRLEQKGETLDWVSLMPNPVPDSQNFLATPALASSFGFWNDSTGGKPEVTGTNPLQQIIGQFKLLRQRLPGMGDWRGGTLRRLADWIADLPSDDIEMLRSLIVGNRAFFAEVRTASRRPFAQMKLSRELALGPERLMSEHLNELKTLKDLAQVLDVSARLNLLEGDAESACMDIESIFALGDAAASQPLLIGFLVKVAVNELSAPALFAGLAERRWPAPQLARLESRLGQVNLVADYRRCLHGERALALAMLGAGDKIGALAVPGTRSGGSSTGAHRTVALFRGWPRALIYRNQINVAEGFNAFLEGRVDPAGPSVSLSPPIEDDHALAVFRKSSLNNFLFPRLLRATEKTVYKAAAGQATVTIARVACALERHRLAKGRYPGSLAELMPGFISRVPADPVNGAPLRYRLVDQDCYVIYSVGPDGADDGGRAITKLQSREEVPAGDWVWQNSLPAGR